MSAEPILIVDDTPVNLKLIRIVLANEGFQVITATSGEEALELLRDHHPKLVLADIQLPGIDGLELARRLKSDGRTRDIAVVALTAFAMHGDEQKAIDAGCDAYITKPVDTRTLGASIRRILNEPDEDHRAPAQAPAPIPPAELNALRTRFLTEGQAALSRWLRDSNERLDAPEIARVVHQWIGAAGLLNFSAIAALAREAEAFLAGTPVDPNRVRQTLLDLAEAFRSPSP